MVRTRHVQELAPGLPQSHRALAFADARHTGQRRSSDGAPFIRHPLDVAAVLYRAGAPDHLIAAGLLHDVVEKAGVSAGELRERFGAHIAALVLAVSEDLSIADYGRRKASLRAQVEMAGNQALTLFAADKVARLRELRRAPHAGPPESHLDHYRQSTRLIERQLTDSPLVPLLLAELTAIDRRLRSHAA
jgi:(p)ppGpp synthase/HD superfamily hydrolase